MPKMAMLLTEADARDATIFVNSWEAALPSMWILRPPSLTAE